MSADIEDIYQLLIKKGLSEVEIQKQVKAKMNEYGGYLTDSGALYLIAKEYDVSFKEASEILEEGQSREEEIDYDEFRVKISDLIEGQDSIVLLGMITRFYKVRNFVRKDGSAGSVASIVVQDETGSVRVNLWDQHAKIVESELFREGLGVRVVGVYAKKGLKDELEVNAGKKAKVELNPKSPLLARMSGSEVQNNQIYTSSEEFQEIPISELLEKEGFVNEARGTILKIEELKDITLKSGEKSFLLKFLLSDDTATIRVNVWGLTAVDYLKSLNEADSIRITSAVVKSSSYSGEKELTLTKKSIIEKLEV